MGCNCKNMRTEIEVMRSTLATMRELFIKRMTIDSDSGDRRRRDYNQSIFHWSSFNQEWRASWTQLSMDMVLDAFDNAERDLRDTFCDQRSNRCK